jgi:hypothetical protein
MMSDIPLFFLAEKLAEGLVTRIASKRAEILLHRADYLQSELHQDTGHSCEVPHGAKSRAGGVESKLRV